LISIALIKIKNKYNMKKSNKGFTLVELLVVISIIGILASVVLVSLNSARGKARDARRISDLHQLSLALENYYDSNANYPATLASLATTYIAAVPKDPQAGANYQYAALGSGTTCSGYHLGATLENASNPAFNSDSDAAAGTACTGSAADFAGTDPIYDIKP
jgi:prepilin-type N-terminal cleavage/methylation domain-containing protein